MEQCDELWQVTVSEPSTTGGHEGREHGHLGRSKQRAASAVAGKIVCFFCS